MADNQRIARKPSSTPPYWKLSVPKCPEHAGWKRDEHGYPIFFADVSCVSCNGRADSFSHPWYRFKYQLLGYCEACTVARMGFAPTAEMERLHAEERARKRAPRFLRPNIVLLTQLRKLFQQ